MLADLLKIHGLLNNVNINTKIGQLQILQKKYFHSQMEQLLVPKKMLL